MIESHTYLMIRSDFAYLSLARSLLALSVGMQSTIMGWQLYEITRNPVDLGLIGLFEAIPALGLALFAGSIADRGDPLKFYAGVFLGTVLSLLAIFIPTYLGIANPVFFFCAAFLTGVSRAFAAPSFAKIFPKLVPPKDTAQAIAWSISANRFGMIAGPAIAGVTLASVGLSLSYALNLSFLLTGLSLLLPLIRLHFASSRGQVIPKTFPAIKEDLSLGVRFVFSHPILLPALALDMFAVLFGGVTAILPVFVKEVLNGDATQLGILRSSFFIGAILMSVFLSFFPLKRRLGPTLLFVIGGFGLATLGFAFSKVLILSVFFLAVAGLCDSISMVIRGAIVQFYAPDEMKGRVASVNSIFIGSSNELGALESGVAARFLGLIPSILFGSIMTLLCVLVALKKAPGLLRLDRLEKLTS